MCLYSALILKDEEVPLEFDFIPKSWLMEWLASPSTVGPIDTSPYLCEHHNLNIDR